MQRKFLDYIHPSAGIEGCWLFAVVRERITDSNRWGWYLPIKQDQNQSRLRAQLLTSFRRCGIDRAECLGGERIGVVDWTHRSGVAEGLPSRKYNIFKCYRVALSPQL